MLQGTTGPSGQSSKPAQDSALLTITVWGSSTQKGQAAFLTKENTQSLLQKNLLWSTWQLVFPESEP